MMTESMDEVEWEDASGPVGALSSPPGRKVLLICFSADDGICKHMYRCFR